MTFWKGWAKVSKYTTQLRWMVESGFDLQLTEYPIFNEAYREKLNQKIIDHFYFREIGFETPGLFRNRLKVRMNEIMPYYNQLYLSTQLDISPLFNEIYNETFTREGVDDRDTSVNGRTASKQTTESEQSGERKSDEQSETAQKVLQTRDGRTVRSDTPQGLLSMPDIENEVYATDAAINADKDMTEDSSRTQHDAAESTSGQGKSSTAAEGDSTQHTLESGRKWEEFTRKIEGVRGVSQVSLLREWRESMLNIDMQIIDELNDLFMGVY